MSALKASDAAMGVDDDLTPMEANLQVWRMAWPSIISELTTPLLGLVDTVVVGHLADAADLSGVALATAGLNPLLFIFNFLRMGTGGVTAQAFGAKDPRELVAGVARGILLALLIGTLLCVLSRPLAFLIFSCIQAPDAATLHRAETYLYARILGAPAELSNFVVQAFLIGVQAPRRNLAVNVMLNLTNVPLCILLGWYLGFGVAGVGAATAVANYASLAYGLLQIRWAGAELPWFSEWSLDWPLVFSAQRLREMAKLNASIFCRSVCLMSIFTDFNALSAQLGRTVLAANNLLLQFQSFLSFGADGFANAAESMTGEAVGRGDRKRVRTVMLACLRWGAVLSVGYSAAYFFFGRQILEAMTWHREVVDCAMDYLPWQWAAPFLSVVAYMMDGIFVGATQPREMRDATFLALVAFLIVGHSVRGSNNWLWTAFFLHVILRAVVLLCYYPRVEAKASENARPLLAS